MNKNFINNQTQQRNTSAKLKHQRKYRRFQQKKINQQQNTPTGTKINDRD